MADIQYICLRWSHSNYVVLSGLLSRPTPFWGPYLAEKFSYVGRRSAKQTVMNYKKAFRLPIFQN